jgi:hypothetical protein
VIRALKLNDLETPSWLDQTYRDIEQRHRVTPVLDVNNRIEKIVTQKYSLNHPNENLISNNLRDGFRFDLDFPDLKLNIELDGPSHRYELLHIYVYFCQFCHVIAVVV